MTAPVQFIPQTPRAFLASLTPPLAVATDDQGRPARGRFGKAGVAALAQARADGFAFIGDDGHPSNVVKAPKVAKAATVVVPGAPAAPKVSTAGLDAKAVRAWGAANGHTVGVRGRLNGTLVSAFLTAGGTAAPAPKAVASGQVAAAPKPKATRVRVQTVAYGRIPRRKSDAKWMTEPILGVSQCGTCRQGVAYCPCAGGPTLPKQYGAGATVFAIANVPAIGAPVRPVTA